jgi:WD40 repeat protein
VRIYEIDATREFVDLCDASFAARTARISCLFTLSLVAFVAGVLILDWETEIAPKIQRQQNKKHSNETCLQHHSVRRQFKPYPSSFEASIEVNDCMIHDTFLYGAAGDAFGCYKWDLETEKIVATYKSTRGGYLHMIERVPNSNLLLTGGEDGILGIWDTGTDKFVDAIDVNSSEAAMTSINVNSSLSSRPSNLKRSAASASSNTTRWISSCKARDENWWTVAGGNGPNGGGFISTWHGPSRSLIATVDTRETPQQLAFYSGANGSSTTLLSVANESFVSHWQNPLSLENIPPQRVWCNQPSAYAVAVSQDGCFIATGGVGSVVDIFEQGTQYGMQLSTH